jgi:hypothetical protein
LPSSTNQFHLYALLLVLIVGFLFSYNIVVLFFSS